MTEQDLIKSAQSIIEAFNNSDWEACKAKMTPDAVYDEAGTSRRMQGLAEIIPGWQGWKEAMPDISGSVTSAYASGDTVFLEVTWQGTHTGPLQGPSGTIPATGKKQITRAAWLAVYEGGAGQDDTPLLRHVGLLGAARPFARVSRYLPQTGRWLENRTKRSGSFPTSSS